MASLKLVKNIFALILFCAEMLFIMAMPTNYEEEPGTLDAHIMHDQRQTGKYNIHVVIKDVAIIEMDKNEISDHNYNDEDYYYDEADLTVKPSIIKTTTNSVKPLDSINESTTAVPQAQTTISPAENQNMETTSQATLVTLNHIVNSTTTNHKNLNKSSEDFMTPVDITQHILVPADIKSRNKIEPIYALEEPVLQSRQHLQNFSYDGIPAQSRDSKIFTNSRIFKVKVHRTHRTTPQIAHQKERCRSHQYRDVRGNCRGMKTPSGSILKRLFKMLVTVPFEQEQQIDE